MAFRARRWRTGDGRGVVEALPIRSAAMAVRIPLATRERAFRASPNVTRLSMSEPPFAQEALCAPKRKQRVDPLARDDAEHAADETSEPDGDGGHIRRPRLLARLDVRQAPAISRASPTEDASA